MAKKKEPVFVTVQCDLLNVRSEPVKDETGNNIVKQVEKGTKLEKLGTANKGAWIKTPIGYVMTKFVS